jgi:hypothetical protein
MRDEMGSELKQLDKPQAALDKPVEKHLHTTNKPNRLDESRNKVSPRLAQFLPRCSLGQSKGTRLPPDLLPKALT